MTTKNQTAKIVAVKVDSVVSTAHQPNKTDVSISKEVADILTQRKRGVSVDGCMVVTHPRSNTIDVVNFGIVNKTSFSNTDTFKFKTDEDMYKFRAALRADFGVRTYCDGEYGGDPTIHTVTRGFDVFAKEIAKIVVSTDK